MRKVQCITPFDLDELNKKHAEHIATLTKIHRRFSKYDAERNRALTETLTLLHEEAKKERGSFPLIVESHNFGFDLREARIFVRTGQQPDCTEYYHLGPSKQEILNQLSVDQRVALFGKFKQEKKNLADLKLTELRAEADALLGRVSKTPRPKPVDTVKDGRAQPTTGHSTTERSWALGRLQFDLTATPSAEDIEERYAVIAKAFADQPSFLPGLDHARDFLLPTQPTVMEPLEQVA